MQFLRGRIGWVIVILLSLSPLVTWSFLIQPITLRFGNIFSSLVSVGQIAALTGFAMYAINLVLSTRLEFFEDLFGGMNNVYIVHHIVGGTAFILFMAHPLLLSLSYLSISWQESLLFFLPSDDWTKNFGIATFGLLTTILLLTFYRIIPYHLWKRLHQLIGLVFFLGIIHAFYIPSDISSFPALRYHMMFFAVIGSLAYLYRTVFGRFFISKYRYTVLSVKNVQSNIHEVLLKPVTMPIRSKPGQFIFISFKQPGFSPEVHPFSISSLGEDNTITISVKDSGDYTRGLNMLKKNAIAYIEGAFGRFSYRNTTNKKQIWIAGGIGITPFYSMAKKVYETPEMLIDLYYTVKKHDEAVYLSELQEISKHQPNFRVFLWESSTHGRLSADTIEKTSGMLVDKDIFLCGPGAMMKSMRKQLYQKHVGKESIHSEEFQLS
jgi:predicted ferric reductase